jgi:ketosteroid isomerase-like protein
VHENARSATVEFETTGTSRSGHEFDNIGAVVIDVDGGLIQAVRVYLDTEDLRRVLEVA